MINVSSLPSASLTINSFLSAETFSIVPLASLAETAFVRPSRTTTASRAINHWGNRIMRCSFPQLKRRDHHTTSPRGGKVADHHLVHRGRGSDLPYYTTWTWNPTRYSGYD